MNRPRANLHPPWRCVLLILATLIFVTMAILGSSAVTIAQDGVCTPDPDPDPDCLVLPPPPPPQPPGTPGQAKPEPVKPEPVKPEPVKPEPAKPEPAKPDSPQDSKQQPQGIPSIVWVMAAAAAGALWFVLRRFRVRPSVGVSPTQGQQTEGEQQRYELNVEPELGFKEARSTATVRVSGTQGMQYLGSYGNRREQRQLVEVTTLGAEPADYSVEFQPGSDEVSATFQKRSSGTGMLRVEILSDSRVQKVQETTAAFGGVTVSWKA